MVPAALLELVLLAAALAGHVVVVPAALSLPGSEGAGALGLEVLFDLGALLAGAFALGLTLEFELFLEVAVEGGALDKVVADAEGLAHAGVGFLLGLGELVALVRLDGSARTRGGGRLLGEEALAEGCDLRFDLGGLYAVVLEGDLEFEALGLDCALALVVEDGLVRSTRGERLLAEVGGAVMPRAVALAEAVGMNRWGQYWSLLACRRGCVDLR